jgi:hypothetical protein
MLMIRWLALPLVAAALITSGCQYLAPSDDIYGIGVARIGDDFHVFAPLCDSERIASVEVVDNQAAGKESNYDPSTMRFTYWKAQDPVSESAARGEIVIGDDGAYRTVPVPAGSKIDFPKIVGITFRINDPVAGHEVGGAFNIDSVPDYPAGSDPKSVKYGYNLGSKKETRLTSSEIQQKSKCASAYVA